MLFLMTEFCEKVFTKTLLLHVMIKSVYCKTNLHLVYDYIIAIDFPTLKIHRIALFRVYGYTQNHIIDRVSILYAFYVSARYLCEIRHFT